MKKRAEPRRSPRQAPEPRGRPPLRASALRSSALPSSAIGTGLLLFTLALVLRLLFLYATPDAGWPYSSFYRGDAVSWLEYARAIHDGTPYELGLPTKPPGMAWLLCLLGAEGTPDVAFLKVVWCVLGAAVVAVFHLACRRTFGPRVAIFAGLAAATSTGLLLLSTSLNNETPYLLLAATCLLLFESLRADPHGRRTVLCIALWSGLNALACLVRVEHILFFLPASALLLLLWGRAHAGRMALRAVLLALCFVLPLLPWEIVAVRNTARVNTELRPSAAALPPPLRELEKRLRSLPTDDAAVDASRALPGFVRRLGTDFVAATVLHRGGTQLRGEDFRILEEAFGYQPEPLAPLPFITNYGPLNFFLANNARATGGFNRLALDVPPPLAGGRERYYPDLFLEPPQPGMLSIDYPPHLEAVNHGYRLGWRWIRENPGAFVVLAARKLGIFWSGASLGFTGFGIPAGLSGLQRAVDLVTPNGWIASIWKLLVIAVCAAGLAAFWRNPALWPWLLFLGSKILVTLLFFGYARIGATVLPVVFVLGALAAERWAWPRVVRPDSQASGSRATLRPRRATTWVLGIVALLVILEGIRFAAGPGVRIDGKSIETGDPFPGPVHVGRRIEVLFG